MAESREKQVNLRKDLAEMQEWMTQVDEEFLMRDFEYKSPEELEASLEEMKVGGKRACDLMGTPKMKHLGTVGKYGDSLINAVILTVLY